MRTLFVGDVHGCAAELRELLGRARPDRVILVGDLFTRGPDPRGVWDLIRQHEAEAVLGNHDAVVLKKWTPGDKLPRRAFRWLAERQLLIRTDRWIAVHAGVDPSSPKKTTRKQAMYLRTVRGKPWWKRYQGKRLVIHGHHARDGLNDRRPYTLGLDTGCVSGGPLTGYLLEEDRLIQVPSRPETSRSKKDR